MLNTPLEILAKDPFILGSLIGGMNHIWGDYLLGSVMRGLISGVTSGICFRSYELIHDGEPIYQPIESDGIGFSCFNCLLTLYIYIYIRIYIYVCVMLYYPFGCLNHPESTFL